MSRLFVVLGLLLLAAGATQAQTLGELAAREKARREERQKKGRPAKVYTERDLEQGGEGTAQPAENPAPPPAPPAPARRSESSEEGSESSSEEGEKDQGLEEQWRERQRQALAQVESARQNLGAAEAEVERLKQDLNPMSTTFSTDPYQILRLQGQLTEAQARADAARQQVEAAQKAVDEVVAEARRAGVYLQ
jgi:chromosome segregation ATPase